MTIICLEGASSVGKSTTARALAADFDACVIDETTYLFERPNVVPGFPNAYFVLYINENDLRRRKENDLTRQRRGFEKHLKLIEPQKSLFTALSNIELGYVKLIEAKAVEDNVITIIQSCKSLPKVERHSIEMFDFMITWMKQNAQR